MMRKCIMGKISGKQKPKLGYKRKLNENRVGHFKVSGNRGNLKKILELWGNMQHASLARRDGRLWLESGAPPGRNFT